MRMATRFAVVVIADFITRDWTTRLPKRHLSLAFENTGPHASENNLIVSTARYWQVNFCPYNAHSSWRGCARGLRTGNLWRPLVSLLLEALRGDCGIFYSPDKSEKPTEVAWQSWGRCLISPFACGEFESSVRQSKYNLELDLWKLDRACPSQDLWESKRER